MIGSSLLKQIAMLALAAGMIFMYVKPNFVIIGETQDQIVSYQNELAKANLINSKLESLVEEVNTISADDMKKLLVYLPSEIDHVTISRDLYNLAISTGLEVRDIKYTKNDKQVAVPTDEEVELFPNEHVFSLNTIGSYPQLKNLLIKLSLNDYPLEVSELKVSADDIGLLTFDITIKTYSVKNI